MPSVAYLLLFLSSRTILIEFQIKTMENASSRSQQRRKKWERKAKAPPSQLAWRSAIWQTIEKERKCPNDQGKQT